MTLGKSPVLLLDMGVIADVVLTIAIVALAAGAIAEFQFRIGNIRPTTNGTPVRVGCLWNGFGCLIGA